MIEVYHVVNSVFSSRTYILKNINNNVFWLVDCGDVSPLVDLLSFLGGSSFIVKGVLLTHTHYDHIYGLPRLTTLFPQMKVYTNAEGCADLANGRKNLSLYHGDLICYTSDNVVVCEEGAVIDLFAGVAATVHYTPGHNPASLTFEVEEYLFTGDAFIPGVAVVTNFPGSDKIMAAQSVLRIQKLAAGKTICPGHELIASQWRENDDIRK